jgi:hypothetical protein
MTHPLDRITRITPIREHSRRSPLARIAVVLRGSLADAMRRHRIDPVR